MAAKAQPKIYKIRRTSDGLFATRNHGYGGIHWSKLGTMWRGKGALRQAFSSSLKTSVKDIKVGFLEIVVLELKETGTIKFDEL